MQLRTLVLQENGIGIKMKRKKSGGSQLVTEDWADVGRVMLMKAYQRSVCGECDRHVHTVKTLRRLSYKGRLRNVGRRGKAGEFP